MTPLPYATARTAVLGQRPFRAKAVILRGINPGWARRAIRLPATNVRKRHWRVRRPGWTRSAHMLARARLDRACWRCPAFVRRLA